MQHNEIMKMDERSRKKKQMPNRRKCMSDEELEIPVS